MTEYLFLRLTLPAPAVADSEFKAQWRLYSAAGQCLGEEARFCTLEDIASAIPPQRQEERKIIVLLPGQTALITEARIKQQHVKHLHSAIADAVEEQIAEPLEDVHMAINPTPVEAGAGMQTYRVAIMQNNLMRELMASLTMAGLAPSVITSESLLLSCSNEKAFLLLDAYQVLFRLSAVTASAMEPETFLVFLNTFTQPPPFSLLSPEKPVASLLKTVELLADRHTLLMPESKAFLERLEALCKTRQLTVDIQPPCDTVFHWLCTQWLANPAAPDGINFLQGPYQPRGRLSAFTVSIPWKPMALLFIAWLCMQMVFDAFMIRYCTFKADQFDTQSVQLYRDLFPKDNKIIDIKAQTLQHLNTSSVANTDGLMMALGILAKDVKLIRRLDIQTLVYDAKQGALTANVRADDFTVFDQYKQQVNNPAWNLEVRDIVREENGVHGKISIWKQHQ